MSSSWDLRRDNEEITNYDGLDSDGDSQITCKNVIILLIDFADKN